LPHRDESVDPRIQQQHLVEDRQVSWPSPLKPAQVDRKTQCAKNQEIPPIPRILMRVPTCAGGFHPGILSDAHSLC
jgi:hypothetical protein